MRLLIYHRDFPVDRPPTLGVCKAVNGLATALAAAGHPVAVLCQNEKQLVLNPARGYEVRSFAPATGRFPSALPPAMEQYVLANTRDSLYLLNAMFHTGTNAMSRLLRRLDVPYVVAPHDPYHPTIFRRRPLIKWPYWYLRERPMLQQAMAVQVLDRRHGKYLQQLGVRTPVVECGNGFSPGDLLPEDQLKWSTEGRPTAAFLGRFDADNKGLDILLDAVADLRPDLRPKLTLQGPDHGDGDGLRLQAQRLGIADDVSFLPPDFTVEAATLTVRHDIFCLVSRFEGFGLAALEAMLAGRVLLVSDIAGIAPHVEASGCGLIVNPEVRSVRDGLLSLLGQREKWREMGMAGRNYVLQNLQWDKIAANVWKEYMALASPRERPTLSRAHVPAA